MSSTCWSFFSWKKSNAHGHPAFKFPLLQLGCLGRQPHTDRLAAPVRDWGGPFQRGMRATRHPIVGGAAAYGQKAGRLRSIPAASQLGPI